MEIKRRLNQIAKRMSPQIEVMNAASQMVDMCNRFDELLDYCEEKIARTAERKGQTIGKLGMEAREKADKEIADAQQAEMDENQADQKESWEERNKIINKSRREPAGEDVTGHDPTNVKTAVPVAGGDQRTEMEKRADEEAQESRDERGATKEEDAAALAEEVKPAKKKAKKKKRRSSK